MQFILLTWSSVYSKCAYTVTPETHQLGANTTLNRKNTKSVSLPF